MPGVTTTSLDPERPESGEPAVPLTLSMSPTVAEVPIVAEKNTRMADAIETCIITAAIVVWLTAATFALMRWTADFWLPLDAAHFSAEAEWLRGNHDVLPNIHPPLFPALVLAADWVVGRWDAVLLAMSFSYAVYVVAVYALLRNWHRPLIAVFAAAVAGTSPLLAEILGWGGGANLLGFAALVGACAAAERWTESGRGAFASGALCGCAGAAHPVAGLLAVVMVVAVIAAKSFPPPAPLPSRLSRSALWFGLGGLPFAVAAARYYLTVDGPAQTTFGFPDLGVTLDLIDWAGREHVVLVTLQLCALLWPFVARGRRSRRTGLVFSSVILILTMTLKGDPSYQSRVMYLLPVLVGILAADLCSFAGSRSRHVSSRPRRSGLVVAVVVVAALLQVSFVTRLRDANDYYRRVTVDDVRLLEQLENSTDGVLASTHWGQSTAEPTGWFVNAATRRRAISPIGPWLSTDRRETEEGAAMQRLFAGQVGIENDVLQIAASASADGLYALQMSVEQNGWFTPAIVLDSARSRFPFPVVAARTEVDGEWIVLTLIGPDASDDRIEVRTTIEGSDVVVVGVPGPAVEGNWHVVFSAAPNAFGTANPLDATTAAFELVIGGARQSGRLSVDAGVPVRVTTYPAGFPIDLDVVDPPAFELTWRFDGLEPSVSSITTFEEDDILEEFGIGTVVVWNNTGLIQRFAESCFRQTGTGPTITVFEWAGRASSDCARRGGSG